MFLHCSVEMISFVVVSKVYAGAQNLPISTDVQIVGMGGFQPFVFGVVIWSGNNHHLSLALNKERAVTAIWVLF